MGKAAKWVFVVGCAGLALALQSCQSPAPTEDRAHSGAVKRADPDAAKRAYWSAYAKLQPQPSRSESDAFNAELVKLAKKGDVKGVTARLAENLREDSRRLEKNIGKLAAANPPLADRAFNDGMMALMRRIIASNSRLAERVERNDPGVLDDIKAADAAFQKDLTALVDSKTDEAALYLPKTEGDEEPISRGF